MVFKIKSILNNLFSCVLIVFYEKNRVTKVIIINSPTIGKITAPIQPLPYSTKSIPLIKMILNKNYQKMHTMCTLFSS